MKKAFQIQYNDSFEIMCRYVKKAGFDFVSLGFGSNKEDFCRNDWEKIAAHVNQLLEQHHLTCVQTHLPYYDLRISVEELDEDMETAIKRCIKTSAELGTNCCVYHPRSAVNQNYSSKVALKENHRVISGYLEEAKKFGTGLALENLAIFPGLRGMWFYTYNHEDLCDLVDSFHDKDVTLCWDFGHAYLTGVDQAKALRDIGSRLSCTHIHDNFTHHDSHLPPTLGWMEWESVMPVLKEIGYEGPLTLEINYKNNDTLERFVAYNYHCVQYLEQLMSDSK